MTNARSIEERFSTALFKIHQAYNLLDLNLGLTIRYLQHPEDVSRSHRWLAESNVEKKIERFSKLASEYLPPEELLVWTKRAHKVRLDRNLYTHAYIEVISQDEIREQRILIQPWMRSKLKFLGKSKICIVEFEDMAEEVETLLQDFGKLRKRVGN